MNIDTFGGRKYVLAVVIIIGAFALVIAGKLGTDQFITFVSIITSSYFGANVVKSFSDKE